LKEELKTKSLSKSDKKAATTLIHKLETEYSSLSEASTKDERKTIARKMKETLSKIRSHMDTEKKTPVVESKTAKNQAKKDKIMKLVKQTELEYQEKTLPATISHKIHAQLEQMKDDLKSTSDLHQLKTKLQSSVNKIKAFETSAKELEEEEKEEKEEKENDFEEEEKKEEDSDE